MSHNEHSPNLYENLILDSGSQRLVDLTSTPSNQRTSENVDEILSVLQRKASKLIDGLADSNKVAIAKHCQLKMYRRNDVVFLQGDEPDAYYTVIRGAVSIYALNSSLAKSDENKSGEEALTCIDSERDQYGVFLLQLPPGESFGELSFNENGVHSRRNASVVSDGSHGQSLRKTPNLAMVQPGIEASDVCILLVVPEQIYMKEMFARHSAKHQTKDKISFLKKSVLFKHWTMDQLVKLGYAMKKKELPKDSTVIRQGERMEYCWFIKEGAVRISHRVNSKQRKKLTYADGQVEAPEQSLTVDIADLGPFDCIGLVESMDENAKKSQRDAVTLSPTTDLFFLPMTFFRSIIFQDSKTLSMIAKVVQRRKKWEFIRREYAIKFPTMNMAVPKNAASLSHYAIRSETSKPNKKASCNVTRRSSINNHATTSSQNESSGSKGCKGPMRKNRENTLDSLVKDAGLLDTKIGFG